LPCVHTLCEALERPDMSLLVACTFMDTSTG
jgi:hypothetical protein